MILEVASENTKNNSNTETNSDGSLELEEVLNDESLANEVLEKMGPEKSLHLTQKIEQSLYKGPLPPAEQLEKYEKVHPGAADRIITMAEKQADHRRMLEFEQLKLTRDLNETHLKSETINNKRGLIFAFVLVLLLIIGGFILILFDKDAYGFASIVASLATLAGTFIYRKKQEQKSDSDSQEDEEKE